MSWCAVVPVKSLASAKSRLHADASSERLALAFAQDTITALLGVARIGRVVVATSDPVVATWAHTVGAEVHDDSADVGINDAVRAAAASHVRPAECLAIVLADLPCLTPAAMDEVIDVAERHPRCFLPDAEGTGTTMWFSRTPSTITTHFGPASRAAHEASGALDMAMVGGEAAWPLARRDVDTADDLATALRLGVGPNTRQAVQRNAQE